MRLAAAAMFLLACAAAPPTKPPAGARATPPPAAHTATGPSQRIADAIRACREQLDMGECMVAGVFHAWGSEDDRVPKDARVALTYLEPACAAGIPEACLVLVHIIEVGAEGIPRDTARAQAITARMCAEGADLFCTRVVRGTEVPEAPEGE
jgi:hypothetical protein